MADEAVKFGLTREIEGVTDRQEKKIHGVYDRHGHQQHRLAPARRACSSMLPWLPGLMPWARLSNMMAGMGRGSFFVPQIGDEVLVAFNHGDVREPYVIGTLWNTMDRPPALSPTDADHQAQDPHAARARARVRRGAAVGHADHQHAVDA